MINGNSEPRDQFINDINAGREITVMHSDLRILSLTDESWAQYWARTVQFPGARMASMVDQFRVDHGVSDGGVSAAGDTQ